MSASKNDFMQLREQEQGISFEHLLDAKKSNLTTAVDNISTAIKDGRFDSLKGLIIAVKGKTFFTELEKSLRPMAESDYLDKLEKGYAAHDVKIEQGATKTEYDFTVCNDPIYDGLIIDFEAAKELLEERKTFLKTITKPMDIVLNEAEVYTINPPNKLQKDGLKLTIAK